MNIKIKFVGDGTHTIPTLGTKSSAAYDLYVPNDTIVPKGRSVIPLGFCMEIPEGYAVEIHPRSGYAAKGMEGYEIISKKELQVTNMGMALEAVECGSKYANLESSRFNADVIYGLVDEDYRNEVGVIVNNNDSEFLIKEGTRIAQMLIITTHYMDFEPVTELTPTDRKGGFGSTNINQ